MGYKEPSGRGDPECEVRLSTVSNSASAMVRFNFKSRRYEPLTQEEFYEDMLTIEPRTILKEEVQMCEEQRVCEVPKQVISISRSEEDEEDEDSEGVITREELRKLDSQPNPFNFSDRVSQTTRVALVETAVQTDPPPSTSFCINVSMGNIYDAYQKDYQRVKKEKEKDIEGEKGSKARQVTPRVASHAPVPETTSEESVNFCGENIKDIEALVVATRTMERMVSQNIYDEITQDFKYWEDGSDEFRPLEGSLLPLWRFGQESLRNMTVSSVSWSPVYPDLFAAAYRSYDISGAEGEGMLCLFTLKNPSAPERMITSDVGVTSVEFHPRLSSILCVGRVDGVVAVYDVKSSKKPLEIMSTAVTGKHLMAVCQVHWINTDPGEDLCFFSIALDGRVTQWFVHGTSLNYNDLLDFTDQQQQIPGGSSDKVNLEGCGTCFAFKPDDESVLLIGSNTGAIFQCTTVATTHDLTKYDAHNAAVKAVKWNNFNYQIFASCSIDWTIKIWVEYFPSPLVVLDISGPCAGIDWYPNISTVLVATNDDGKINVFDLFLKKCKPLCVQNLVQKRKFTFSALGFSPFFPVVLVGGNKGYLVTFKLSPNLRKIHKDAKGGDEQKHREVEIAKIERMLAVSKGNDVSLPL